VREVRKTFYGGRLRGDFRDQHGQLDEGWGRVGVEERLRGRGMQASRQKLANGKAKK